MTPGMSTVKGKFRPPALSLVLFLALIAAAFSLFYPASAAADEIDRLGYTSSRVCGYCHVDIYESWKKSVHSRSYTDQAFQDAYRKAHEESKGRVKGFCLRCHAPTTYTTKDAEGSLPITREGVTCDFCHTIERVDLDHPFNPYTLDVGGRKRASMRLFKKPYVETPAAHVAEYSNWFKKSEMCAGCHEMLNKNGLKIGNTYTEWKGSVYAEQGVECQNCHMAPVPGTPIDPSVKKTGRTDFHDHGLLQNLAKLSAAVELELVSAKYSEAGSYIVDVAMTNVQAGHNIPTGTPSRTLALEVTIIGDGLTRVSQTRTFGKRVEDKNGNWLTTDAEAQLKGVRIEYNTALKPKERRVVRFVFSSVPPGKIHVFGKASLTHNPVVDTEERVIIPLGSVQN